MAYRILPRETAAEAVRRIAREQVEKAVATIDDARASEPATVHDVRKRCKKIRGLIRLVRPAFPAYSQENARFRDTAGRLSAIRDATGVLECFDALMQRYEEVVADGAFDAVRDRLLERRREIKADLSAADRIREARATLDALPGEIEAWHFDADEFAAVGPGVGKTYGRARAAMKDAFDAPTPERMHEWRKRVKYNRYHARLLRETWPPIMKPWRTETKRLSDILGDHHDLAVLRAMLEGEEPGLAKACDLSALFGLVDQRSRELEDAARPLGRRLYAERPDDHVRRLRKTWKAWRSERASRRR